MPQARRRQDREACFIRRESSCSLAARGNTRPRPPQTRLGGSGFLVIFLLCQAYRQPSPQVVAFCVRVWILIRLVMTSGRLTKVFHFGNQGFKASCYAAPISAIA